MKILHLTLKRQWFDAIVFGIKKTEYREIKPHWETRLEGQTFDEVHFRNGYGPISTVPFIRVEFKGISKNGCYEIHLGEILEIRNYPIND